MAGAILGAKLGLTKCTTKPSKAKTLFLLAAASPVAVVGAAVCTAAGLPLHVSDPSWRARAFVHADGVILADTVNNTNKLTRWSSVRVITVATSRTVAVISTRLAIDTRTEFDVTLSARPSFLALQLALDTPAVVRYVCTITLRAIFSCPSRLALAHLLIDAAAVPRALVRAGLH